LARIAEGGVRLTLLPSRSGSGEAVIGRTIRMRNGRPPSILREMLVCRPAPVHALDPLSFNDRRPARAEF
jgi:hypothetical protein